MALPSSLRPRAAAAPRGARAARPSGAASLPGFAWLQAAIAGPAALLQASAGLVAQLLWPERCCACGGFVPPAVAFCEPCADSVLPLGPACPRCASPGLRGAGCPVCLRGDFAFDSARAVLSYGGAVADALVRFKHGGRIEAAAPLGALLAPALRQTVTRLAVDLVLPVPLHPRRLRHRGYNQALLLARGAWRGTDGGRAPARIAPDLLLRTRDTAPLGRDAPGERRERLRGAFAVRRARAVAGRRVLLVDDVLTTGATASACAAVLRAAGAPEVHVLVLARAE